MKQVIYLLIIFSIVVHTSCVTNKPWAEKVSLPDYNQRITVDKPRYVKKENALGISLSIGFAGLGGYLGYQSDMIQPSKAKNKDIAQVGNVVLGTMVGYSVTKLITRMVGKNRVVKVKDKNKWLKSLKQDFVFVDNDNDEKWVIINHIVEQNYRIKSLSDVMDFKKAFPVSKYKENMLLNAFEVIPRKDIPEVLNLYPNTIQKTKYQLRFYKLSKNVSELRDAIEYYPESKEEFDICNNIENIVSLSNEEDLDYLAKEYRGVDCYNVISSAIISNCSSIKECYQKSLNYPELRNQLGNKALSLAENIDDYIFISKNYPNVKEEADKRINEIEYNRLIKEFIEDEKGTIANYIAQKIYYKATGKSGDPSVSILKSSIDEKILRMSIKVSWEETSFLNAVALLRGAYAHCWAEADVRVDFLDDNIDYKLTDMNSDFSARSNWTENGAVILGSLAAIGIASWEGIKWLGKQTKSSQTSYPYSKCSLCNNSGWRECVGCGGDGVENGLLSNKTCSDCGGRGTERCYHGSNKQECTMCGNSGWKECLDCGGDGIDNGLFSKETCKTCGGRGTLRCYH